MKAVNKHSVARVVALVPARAGSKGLPGKNIKLMAGKKLYQYASEQALRVVGNCVISTDIKEIITTAHPENCKIIERPRHLALDSTPMDAVICNVLDHLEESSNLPDVLVLLQVTSPLRNDEDIKKAIALFNTKKFDLVLSVTETERSVLKYGMVSKDGEFIPLSKLEYCFQNRQSLPPVVRPNGAIFVFSVSAFRHNRGLAMKKIGAVSMPKERSLDIDSIKDWDAISELIAERDH